MRIKMLNKHGRNAVQNALVNALLKSRKRVQLEKLFVTFDVDEWRTFLSLLWLAYSVASRQSDGEAMRQRYRVSITTADGKVWHTDVWYDITDNSIHYANLC